MQRVLKEETTGCHPARILSPKNKLNSDQKEPKISTQAGENGDHAVKSAGIRTHMLRASCSHDLIASHAPVLEPRSRHGGAPATGQSFPTQEIWIGPRKSIFFGCCPLCFYSPRQCLSLQTGPQFTSLHTTSEIETCLFGG